jgi:hypothetical protein
MSLECAICERDLRGGHDEDCPRYRVRPLCKCGHRIGQHDEEGMCMACRCGWYAPVQTPEPSSDEQPPWSPLATP